MYLQFIHGKLVGNKGSLYQLVARCAALTNEASLKTMAEGTHRFWGSTSPVRMVQAVGVFLHENNLVLVKSETAVEPNGNLAVNGDRGFDQHRYVFIPVTSISGLKGRTYKLLVWMLNQPIPLLTTFNADLKPLFIPILEEPIPANTIDNEVDQIRQCLPDSNEGKSLVLLALAGIINGKRLLVTNEQSAIPFQILIQSILLLLPASIRPQISVAVGTLDEWQCPWATLVVKTNQHLPRLLPEDMIWLNQVNLISCDQSNNDIFENSYANYIHDHITTAPDTLKQLIQQLDKVVDNDITLETLANPKTIVCLISVLPKEQQTGFLIKYLSGLNIDIWSMLTPLIITKDYQHGLIFAWEELSKKVTLESQAITLMLQIWSALDNANLILLLDELNDNLPLAEILLKDMLLLDQPIRKSEATETYPLQKDVLNIPGSQSYQTLPHYTKVDVPYALSGISNTSLSPGLSSSVIITKLSILCRNVVAYKASSSLIESWEFATNLATHKFFADEKKTFSLLDAGLLGELTIKYVYNCFALKFGILLPCIEVHQFKQSNLCQQLATKNAEVADLIDTLLSERNLGLAKLSQIAKLTDMNYGEKNKFYEAFLRIWSPSNEDARPLLVSVIKESQIFPNKFSRDNFSQTYTWFEQQQPKIKAVFDSLQQDYSYKNWDNLAMVIYETQKEQAEFVDTLVGNIFPVAVMQKWLPLIVGSDIIRKSVISKSPAWQALTLDDFHKLLRSSQRHVTTLMRCLRDGDGSRLPWISGDLLYYLCQAWIQQKTIDEDLKDVITSPRLTDVFTTRDWLFLQRLSWEPGIQLELSLGCNMVLTPDQNSLFLMHAKTAVARYSYPEQTRRLLNDCEGWGFDMAQQKEILSSVHSSAFDVNTIIFYLYREGKVINPEEEQQLIGLLLQKTLAQAERADLEKFSCDIFIQYILPSRNWPLLKWWRDKAAEKELYKKAFSTAVQQYVQNVSIMDFFNYIAELKTASLADETALMFKVTFSWIPDLLIQPIIHFLRSSQFLGDQDDCTII